MSGRQEREVGIRTPSIRLDQFLKWAAVVPTGGRAKEMIVGGSVKVNGVAECRRTSALRPGDLVEVDIGGPSPAVLRVVARP
ncbi:MAG: RNA-binding S4 domain-containing protein [Firmicutes bacterium]|nr:RNA-binding S4 domain-containing protein [Bacillota bacterium]